MKQFAWIMMWVGLAVSAVAVEPLWKLEKWDEGRQLVWANPGEGGEFGVAENWKENGKTAKTAPDRETDILLPKASKNYIVKGNRQNQVRHVVIEKNGELQGKHRNELEIWGNVDVKDGGDIHWISIRGDHDTYFNIEDAVFPGKGRVYRHTSKRLPKEKSCNSQISHKFQIAKIGTKSVEFLGNVGVSDEVMLQHGKCIISGDFRFSGATNKGAFEVYDGGILEIQGGGRIAPFINTNAKGVYNINIYRNGVLQAGSPERPLTEDAFLCLGFAENDKPGRSGLYAALGSFIRVYSANPKKARLVVTSITSVDDFTDGQGRKVGNPNEKAKDNKGVAMQLAGDVQLDGVHFDYIMEDGIGLFNKDVSKDWKNVTFGKHCASTSANNLIAKMEADPNSYYHGRGDQKSEYGLTLKAMTSMSRHLGEYEPFQLNALPANTKIRKVGKGGNQIETPVAVIFDEPVKVEIKTKVPGAKIRYTTDGSEPTGKSPAYTAPIKLNKTTKLTVKAYKKGVGFSPTYTTTYVIN
ncbi:chitobiase/beta-hexosaminidase C-terminal domain-containing protein [Pontiellaceae bacterium B12227]|nr:chitobiase/beta-hexosaminidase C-terminal domain-containing protein [Pontiellaceae bacterium B12227]